MNTNELRGEAYLEVGGTKYRLANTIDAMMALESHFSTPENPFAWDEALPAIERGSLEHIRVMLWSFFQTYHPEVELKDIGRLMHEAGGKTAIIDVVKQVLEISTPDRKDVEALGNPQKAQATKARNSHGTGAHSTSTPVASA